MRTRNITLLPMSLVFYATIAISAEAPPTLTLESLTPDISNKSAGGYYGGVAVAGADPKIDEKCAEAGIAAVQETLEFAD